MTNSTSKLHHIRHYFIATLAFHRLLWRYFIPLQFCSYVLQSPLRVTGRNYTDNIDTVSETKVNLNAVIKLKLVKTSLSLSLSLSLL